MHGDAQILILEWEADVLISSCLQLPCLPSYLVNAAYCCEIMKYVMLSGLNRATVRYSKEAGGDVQVKIIFQWIGLVELSCH